MRGARLYRYVGPPHIAVAARGVAPGQPVRSVADLTRATRDLGANVLTYVVDGAGVLRVAARESEHVACAAGGLVLAAGELVVAADGRAVTDASNLSTGYCPEPTCLDVLGDTLDAAAIGRPGRFETTFALRRCPRCSARVVVKDGALDCPECDGVLPERWNFERATVTRTFVGDVRIDALVEAGSHDEDRVGVRVRDRRVDLVLADGAGNSRRGRAAAERAVGLVDEPGEPGARLARLDALLARDGSEAAVVIATVGVGDTLDVHAALAGDARLWARASGIWRALSDDVPRKPLVGSGAAPSLRRARGADAILCASDGLAAWPGPELDDAVLAHDDAVLRLADAVRLRSGRLADDTSIVLVGRH